MYFDRNIKFLRRRHRLTQKNMADLLKLTRSSLNGYENNISRPTYELLVDFSNFFRISVDTLLKLDLSLLSEFSLQQIEKGADPYIRGSDLRVLITTVDLDNKENIEMVGEKAKAGYATGFADLEYIKELPRFSFPVLSKNKKYRSFQISGDSMLPIPDGSWITAEYIQDWLSIKDDSLVIVLTLQEGILFKKIQNRLEEHHLIVLSSLNPWYKAIEIHVSEIREIWKFNHFLSQTVPELNLPEDAISQAMLEMKRDMEIIKQKLNM